MLSTYILVNPHILGQTGYVLHARWKVRLGISGPRPATRVPTIATASEDLGAKVIGTRTWVAGGGCDSCCWLIPV